MDRQILHSNPLGHQVVFILDPNREDHSSLLIRRLRITNAKGSRCNSRRRTKEKERPLKLMLLREKCYGFSFLLPSSYELTISSSTYGHNITWLPM